MDSYLYPGNRGASIIPAARKSIHSHRGCQFNNIPTMVRYGVDNEGIDEVDNVISKPVTPINLNIRRGSMTIEKTSPNKFLTDEESCALSKSLPTTLPSYSNCSDDWDDLPTRFEYSDTSYHSASHNRSTDTTQQLDTNLTNGKKGTTLKHFVSLSIVLAIVALIYARVMKNGANVPNDVYDEHNFYKDVSLIGKQHYVDNDALLKIQAGISTIYRNQDTGSFIFVYDSNSVHFNEDNFNKFVSAVSVSASKFLRNESFPMPFTSVNGANLNMKEHGELICKYKKEFDSSGLILVKYLEAIPSTLAMAFHYYCDEYNPLSKKSAVFFTMNMAKCSRYPAQSLHANIEKCLKKKWSDISMDNIGPLLTRVVSVVIDMTGVYT